MKKALALILGALLLLTSSAMAESAPKPVLLVVSFGTSYNESRDVTIGAIEAALQEAYPDYEVRRAFTSQIIIDKLKERDGLDIDNVTEAMERLTADGVKTVVIQPTHVMSGFEYDDVVSEVSGYADQFDSFKLGKTLLADDGDYDRLITVLTGELKAYSAEDTAIVFMGHGTEHPANATYGKLQEKLIAAGFSRYFVGTVEAAPSLEDVLTLAKESGAKKVVLTPLMIVAGDHANNDMAGDDEDSWKSQFTAAGFEVECLFRGLGQYEGVQQMIVDHAAATIEQQSTPVQPTQLKEGTYEITVSSSSSMFRVVKAELTVKDGAMTAVITLSGKGYGKVYMGTGEEAAALGSDAGVSFVEDADGAYTYHVPVQALDQELDCAAWSIKKEKWYDRVLVFESTLLPQEAWREII